MISLTKQWNFCNTAGAINDHEESVIKCERGIVFKTDRISKQIRAVEITEKL